ncbi:MAG: hypothetical protein ACRDPA_10710 [Solirubrobacteraceae bacterium]
MPQVSLDWSAAEVKSSKLTVPLEGDIPKGWKRSFETTVRLLGSGDWGDIEVKKNAVRVADVEPGSEDKLHHHLEAVVAQANADHEPDDSEDDAAPDGDKTEPEGDDEDAEMTRRFRSM